MILGLSGLLSVGLLFASFDSGRSPHLRIDFLDVGQGDSILVTSPSGVQLLVDAGRDTSVLRSLGKVMPFMDRFIDVIVATHPDADHIGGFPRVLGRFEVAEIIGLNSISESNIFQSFSKKSKEERAELLDARRGMLIDLGSGVFAQILFPYKNMTITGNDSSVVIKIIYKQIEVLLTADASIATEKHLISLEGDLLESDILKLGHHGSKTSSSQEFLEMVEPKIVIISAGFNNSYGHPHPEVIEKLEKYQIPFVETSKEGTITIFSDGKSFWRR